MVVEQTDEVGTFWNPLAIVYPPVSTTSGQPPLLACGICSNGPTQIFHIGGPCPYAYRHKPTCPHCGQETS